VNKQKKTANELEEIVKQRIGAAILHDRSSQSRSRLAAMIYGPAARHPTNIHPPGLKASQTIDSAVKFQAL
jgi:hypothetical protein